MKKIFDYEFPIEISEGFEPDTMNVDLDDGPDKKPKLRFRSVFISDVHLGTKDCKAEQLLGFLKNHQFDSLYLVGDIFDGWKMRKNVYWKKSFTRVVRRILKLAKAGVEVTYVSGNHDEFLRKYGSFDVDSIRVCHRTVHSSATGLRYLVIHGDQFESVARCGPLLKIVGHIGYEVLMILNRTANVCRSRFGFGYWSCAHFLKTHIKRANRYIRDYEKAVVFGAKKQGFDGVICGHIHHAAKKDIDGVAYLNTGDWVESCTAIVEYMDGSFDLVSWPIHQSLALKVGKQMTWQR